MSHSTGQGLMELADLISRREYNWALVRARVYEEELVHSYAYNNGLEYTSLADTIEALYRKKIITEKTRENLHEIRILGNKAVHSGDNDPQDAKNAYYMLKEELQNFSGEKPQLSERTPVRVNVSENQGRAAEEEGSEARRRRPSGNSRDEIDISHMENRKRRPAPQNSSARNKNGRGGKNGKKKFKKTASGIDLYTILKILIPVVIVVLLIILCVSLFHKPSQTEPATAESVVETVAEEETEPPTEPVTEPPTTEAPAAYQITCADDDGSVNIRYASNPSQIYTQLNKGTYIGTVEDFSENPEYADFAKFKYDGKDVIVSKRFIERVN